MDVVVAGAAGNLLEGGDGVLHRAGVYIVELHAVFLGLLHCVDAGGPFEAGVVNIGDHQQRGPAVGVDDVVDGGQTHGAHTGQQGQLAALYDAHLVLVDAVGGVVVGVEGAADAGQGFGQRAKEKGLPIIGQ